MLVDVVLILHVSLTTKITVTLFTIISTYSPLAAEKSGGTIDRATTDLPYNEAHCTGAGLYSLISRQRSVFFLRNCGFHRLIVVAEKQVVYDKFPIPLINRLEKHFLAMTTMLDTRQMKVLGELKKWARAFAVPDMPMMAMTAR